MKIPFLPLIVLALAAPLQAAGPNPRTPSVFSVHDLDRDGYLSRAEYAALQAQCLDRSRAAAHPRGRHRCALLDFDRLDANRDGRIDEDELVDALGRRYRGGGNFSATFNP
jgi:Ca2+-binding EF-hand superfamily protein